MTRRATESECQTTIVEAAKYGGWLVHAERPARRAAGGYSTPIQGHRGFPDLVLVHPVHRLVVIAELKRRPNKVEPEQRRWLDALAATLEDSTPNAGRVAVVTWWVPDDLDPICLYLANPKGNLLPCNPTTRLVSAIDD
jgi:hypothetical protein